MKGYIVRLIKDFVKMLITFCVLYLIHHVFFEHANPNPVTYSGAFTGTFIVYAVRLKYKMDDESEDDDEV